MHEKPFTGDRTATLRLSKAGLGKDS